MECLYILSRRDLLRVSGGSSKDDAQACKVELQDCILLMLTCLVYASTNANKLFCPLNWRVDAGKGSQCSFFSCLALIMRDYNAAAQASS